MGSIRKIHKFEYLGIYVCYYNISVNMLAYSVAWLFGGLHDMSTRLPVIVSVYRLLLAFVAPSPLRKAIRPV